jgi:bleomycin hydrolase
MMTAEVSSMARPAKVEPSRHVLTREWIRRATDRACASLARESINVGRLRRRGFEAAALDAEVLALHNRRYSLELPFGAIANQEQSGRCWLFAPVVLARTAALRSQRIAAGESFSETYLYFFNLLEQASETLADVRRIAARKDSLAGDTLRRGLSGEVMGLADGGEWEWSFDLIEKYGLVPSRSMPETASSKNTRALGVDLHERFARAARAIRRAPENYRTIRDRALADIVRILVAHLGSPPTLVTWHRQRVAPTYYATDIVGFRPAEWRVVISNPLLPFGRVYERRGSAISGSSPRFNLRRLNVSPRRLRDLVGASLEAGYAAGFSADVDRNDIDHRRGIMHPSIFNRSRVYGSQMIRDLPRREDIYLGVASSKHAMAIAGLDRTTPGSNPIKYRVVNSWGPDLGDHGVYHMYAEWFDENVFKLAIHESVLDDRERAAYQNPEPVPGGNFY